MGEMSDVKIEALFPDTLSDVSVPEFLSGLTAFDAEIEERRKKAAADNAVLRYVASIKEGSYEVGLKSVPKTGPIGSLRGTDNILSLTSDIYSETPLVIQGSGAGADITAAGVIADMIDI